MKKAELKTPTILLNMKAIKNNIEVYQELCDKNGKGPVNAFKWPWKPFYGIIIISKVSSQRTDRAS